MKGLICGLITVVVLFLAAYGIGKCKAREEVEDDPAIVDVDCVVPENQTYEYGYTDGYQNRIDFEHNHGAGLEP